MKAPLRPAWIALSLGILLTLASAIVSYLYVSQLTEQRLISEVEKVRQGFVQKLAATETIASAIQDLAHAMSPLDLPEAALQNFAESVMARNTAIRSILYYKRISSDQRAAFEAELVKKGVTDGIVNTSPTDSNAIENAPEAPEYFVLTAGDRPAISNLFLGWNLLSDRSRASALSKSLEAGLPTATDAYLLSDGHSAIEVIIPIYRSFQREKNQEQQALIATVGVVIDLTSMLGNVELRKNFTTVLKTRFSSQEEPRSVYRSLDESANGLFKLSTFHIDQHFSSFSYEIILGIEKEIYLSKLNYGILIAVGMACFMIIVLGLYLANSMEKIAALNLGLELKVKERTRELEQSRNEIQEILDNLDDAVLIIDDKLQLQSRHSPSAPRMLGLEQLVGKSLGDILLKDMDPKAETVGRHKFTLDMLFHSDTFQWDISAMNLLKSINYIHPNKEGQAAHRKLSVRYAPLYEKDSIERILVIISDVTELLMLRQDVEDAREQSNQRLQIVSEMLAVERSSIVSFFEEVDARHQALRTITQDLEKSEDTATLTMLFREIHTLKGNSRMLKFARLAREAHEFEDLNANLIRSQTLENAEQRSGLVISLKTIIDSIEQYRLIYAEIFAGQNSKQEAVKLWDEVFALSRVLAAPEALTRIAEERREDRAFRLQNLWQDYQSMVNEIAERLGKHIAPLQIQGDAWLNRRLQGPLRDALTHLVRNALDHGIESPEQREGKAQVATLTLNVTAGLPGQIDLQLKDDGRGIDPELVFGIAKKKGLVPADSVQPRAEDVYELLFASGFSTKSEASDISGRGVGLDAVRSALQEHGGQVSIESQKGHGTTFHISIPSTLVLIATDGKGEIKSNASHQTWEQAS